MPLMKQKTICCGGEKMKSKIKKYLIVLMSVVVVTVSIGAGLTWGEVKAAGSPYMMKLTPGGGKVYTSFENFEVGATYTMTCKYYAVTDESKTETTNGYVPVYFQSALNPYSGRNEISWVGNLVNQVNTLTISYTTQSGDNWLAIAFDNPTSAKTLYYWDIEVHKGDSSENCMRNPGFKTGDGSWIGWQMEKYEQQSYIDTAEKSQEATKTTGNQIIPWDETIGGAYADYTWDAVAKTVTFAADMSFELSTIDDYQLWQNGKAFLGWQKNGAYVTATDGCVDVRDGDVLKAVYLEYDSTASGDFAICSEEMRTDAELGLRWKVVLSNSLEYSLPNISEYGTVVLPTKILNATWSDLLCGGQYLYNGTNYEAAMVQGTNIYAEANDRIYYTLCITGLTEDKYDRQYTAKGYIKYTDNNGEERTLYTNSVSTNPYLTSVNDLTAAGGNETLNTIVDFVKNAYQTERETLDNGRKIYLGNSEDPTTLVYQLSNGLRVREVNITTDKGGDPIEIMHITDLHYAYMNELDEAQANPTLLAEYKIRNQWPTIAYGASAKVAEKVFEYARVSDQIVVTGDVLDFLSHGTVELMKRTIWDKYPNTIITMGNHEPEQAVAAQVEESLTAEMRMLWLSNAWKHDLHYSSKVLGEKVMLIQMNNSETKFYEHQVAPLTNDLAKAKKEGYTVLLFMHEPLQTGKTTDTAVSAIRGAGEQADLQTLNFASDDVSSVVSPNKDASTKAVFDLIKENADIIKGIFNGHVHTNFYTEIQGTNGTIPQYTLTSSVYDSGCALKITVN